MTKVAAPTMVHDAPIYGELIRTDLTGPMTPVSASHALEIAAPAYWRSLTAAERHELRLVRVIQGGLLTKVTAPALPQAFVSAIPSDTPTGSTFTVNAGENLQAAINAAAAANPNLNHEIVLQAGATFTGQYVIPSKSGPGIGWVTIRSSAWASLPPSGQRITRADAVFMPKLVQLGVLGSLKCDDGLNKEGWRMVGIESFPITTQGNTTGSSGATEIWWFGWNPTGADGVRFTQADIDKRPRRFIIDRCYLHPARDNQYVQRALTLNMPDVRLIGSIIHGQGAGQDCQGLFFYIGGGGPKLIENNEILGTGQNIFFGGPDGIGPTALIDQEQAHDVIVRRNYLPKLARWNRVDPSWDGIFWTVKPIIEIKQLGMARGLIEGNVMENAFAWGPIHWSTFWTHDVTVQHNVATGCASGGTFWDTSGFLAGSPGIRRVKIFNNFFSANRWAPGPSSTAGPDSGMFMRLLAQTGNTQDLWIEHNTGLCNVHAISFSGNVPRWRLANNIFGYGGSGVSQESSGSHSDNFYTANGFVDRDHVQNALVNMGWQDTAFNPSFTDPNDPWKPTGHWPAPNASELGTHTYLQSEWGAGGTINAAGQYILLGTGSPPGSAAVFGLSTVTGRLDPASPLTGIGVDFDNVPDGTDLGVNFALLNDALGIIGLSPPVITNTPYRAGDTVVTGTGQAGCVVTLYRNGVPI